MTYLKLNVFYAKLLFSCKIFFKFFSLLRASRMEIEKFFSRLIKMVSMKFHSQAIFFLWRARTRIKDVSVGISSMDRVSLRIVVAVIYWNFRISQLMLAVQKSQVTLQTKTKQRLCLPLMWSSFMKKTFVGTKQSSFWLQACWKINLRFYEKPTRAALKLWCRCKPYNVSS